MCWHCGEFLCFASFGFYDYGRAFFEQFAGHPVIGILPMTVFALAYCNFSVFLVVSCHFWLMAFPILCGDLWFSSDWFCLAFCSGNYSLWPLGLRRTVPAAATWGRLFLIVIAVRQLFNSASSCGMPVILRVVVSAILRGCWTCHSLSAPGFAVALAMVILILLCIWMWRDRFLRTFPAYVWPACCVSVVCRFCLGLVCWFSCGSRPCIRLDQCVPDTMVPGDVVRLVPIGPMSDSTNMCWLLTVSTVDGISGCGR